MQKHRPSKKLTEEAAKRANYRCEYCQALSTYSPSPFHIDHITPYSLGGILESKNVAYACSGCNGSKSNRMQFADPITDFPTPCFHPRIDTWENHFRWSQDTTLIIGITPIGRATIEGLKLNRKELLNLRRLLKTVGLHPPS